MRSTQLQLANYRTDKVANGYLRWYDELFADRWADVRRVLELGVYRGGSMELWRDYFPGATIVGIDSDLSQVNVADRTRIEIVQGSQTDAKFLHGVARRLAPDGFDVIIDDAAHVAWKAEASFWPLFDDHLKPGGLFVIEDWGTGYLPTWPDGRRPRRPWRMAAKIVNLARRFNVALPYRSHSYGMVGFIKKLVDEQGSTPRASKFAEMIITPGLVAIRKA